MIELSLARFKDNSKGYLDYFGIIPNYLLEDKYLDFLYSYIDQEKTSREELKRLIEVGRAVPRNVAVFAQDALIRKIYIKFVEEEELEEVGLFYF